MNEFVLFGPAHVGALIVVVALALLLPLVARRCVAVHRWSGLGRLLALALLFHELVRIIVRVGFYEEPLSESLPLHLCGAALLLTAVVLWSRHYRAFEVAYFWGIGGSLAAMLTPDLRQGFPAAAFIFFFSGHGLVLLGVAYATLVYALRPRLRSVGMTLAVTAAYAAVITVVNLALGTNYLYLCRRPEGQSVLDYFGPWPWYLGGLGLLTVGACLLCYLPVAITAWLQAFRRASTQPEEPD